MNEAQGLSIVDWDLAGNILKKATKQQLKEISVLLQEELSYRRDAGSDGVVCRGCQQPTSRLDLSVIKASWGEYVQLCSSCVEHYNRMNEEGMS